MMSESPVMTQASLYPTNPTVEAQFRPNDFSRRPQISIATTHALYILISALYASGIFFNPYWNVIQAFKWIAAFYAFVIFLSSNQTLGSRPYAIDTRWIFAVLFVVAIPIPFSQDVPRSAEFISGIILLLFASALVAQYFASAGAERIFFDIIAKIGQPIIVISLLMWTLHMNLGRSSDRFSAWTDNPNTLGLIIAPTIVILMAHLMEKSSRRRRLTAIITVAGLFLLLQTGSRASILFVTVGGTALYAFRKGLGWVAWLSMIGAIFAFALWNTVAPALIPVLRHSDYQNGDILSGRSEVWEVGVHFFKQHPIFGIGPGLSKEFLENWDFKEAEAEQFHNSYLTILVEFGLVGAAAVAPALIGAILKGAGKAVMFRDQPSASNSRQMLQWALPWALLVGAIAHGVFETWFLSPGNPNMFMLWVCISFLVCKRYRRRGSRAAAADPSLTYARRYAASSGR